MTSIEPAQLFLLAVALGAGLVRGFAGFGGPLLMLPIVNQVLAPAATMWVVMWVDMLVNVRLLPDAAKHACRPVLAPLLAGTLVTMPLGVLLLANADPGAMKRGIGAAVLAAALIQLAGWRYPRPPSRFAWIGAGMLSGVVMGATSIAVTVALFLAADRQTAAQARANFIIWVFVATVVLMALLVLSGTLRPGYLGMIALLAPAYFAGTYAGTRLHGRAPDHVVRRAVLVLAAVVGGAAAVL